MGPPLNTWLYGQGQSIHHKNQGLNNVVNSDLRKSAVVKFVDIFRVVCVNYTFALVLFQIFSFQCVRAGPVVFNMDYSQGPVPLARNIRHLPCISRKTGQEGLCMFAIDCLKSNGTHLGTCIDRFYFGSCCQIPDKTILPQIIGNHIDDNSIDGANFVHPQHEVQNSIKIPDIFKATTQKVKTTNKVESTTLKAETKSDETTIDNKIINDEKITTQESKLTTEIPIKLSTFQTVSGESSTEKIETKAPETISDSPSLSSPSISSSIATSPSITTSQSIETSISTSIPTTVTLRPKPTRKPTRPSSFTRPTYKPYNITRPQYTQTTFKPKTTKPVLSTTRKPPYRLPPKRPSTKKPLPLPPRLNITILPQSTSSKPLFTRPQFVITYINSTQTKEEPKITTSSTTTPSPTTPSTTTPSTTTPVTTEKVIEVTEKIMEVTEKVMDVTEKVMDITEKVMDVTENVMEVTEKVMEVTEKVETTQPETTFLTTDSTEKVEKITIVNEVDKTTELIKETTIDVTEKETLRPVTEADIPVIEVMTTSSEYPPFATWSSNTDVIKTTERVNEPTTTTSTTQETWSPITPDWILLSSIAPKPETTISSSTTEATIPTTTTEASTEAQTTEAQITEATIPQETTLQLTETTERAETLETEITTQPAILTTQPTILTTQQTILTTQSTTEVTTQSTTKVTTQSTTTTTPITTLLTTNITTPLTTEVPKVTEPILEFTVNVTLTPTVPMTTDSSLTFTLLSESNGTKNGTVTTTESSGSTAVETSTNATTTVETTTEAVNMTDFKNVCGRRLWQAPTGRIVGGAKSEFGMWPWQISLRQYRTSTYLHKCGAALLNENWAITAAHCVEHVPPSELLVRLGEHDLANEDEPYGFAERRVQIVASHPHFDPATFEYDIALLRFYEPVTFQPNILPVCVPDDDDDFVGRTAYVTGWGRLYDEGPLPSVLQEVKVPVINNSACEAMYQAAGYNEHIPNIFICAGRREGGTDSCEGDSGGPMVLPRKRDGRFVLGGVISWGIGCAEPNQPGVYTRISEFRDWINQILQF